jgi:uncharacterized membrane protein
MTRTPARARNWHPGAWLHALRARPRLAGAMAFGGLVWWLLPLLVHSHDESRALVAWNAGALLYLALAAHMVRSENTERMRRRALHQDEGRFAILLLVVVAAAAVLLAVGSQLAAVKGIEGLLRTQHIALAALTVVTSWLFTQVLFALHYAHDFYMARQHKQADPLVFPGTTEPGYGDFLYFACVIGTSGQTADVCFNGSALRGVGTLHCVLAFFFNATLLALTINIAAGLL